MPPLFSLYHIVKERRPFGRHAKFFEDAAATVRWVPRLFNQTIPILLEAAGVRYAMNVSKSTYRPSGLPAILTDGSVSNKIKIGNEVYRTEVA